MSRRTRRQDGPRVVLVTGASSGIGRATARRAARSGAHVVLVARGAQSLAEAAHECEDDGAASATVAPLDVADDDAVRDCVADVVRRHGRLDVVVNAAGVVSYGRTEDVPPEVMERVLRTNVLGSVTVARHVLPVFREQGEGTLVLTGSVIGHLAIGTMTPYVLSKWGVRALARQLRVENRHVPGIRIRYVAPGGVDTPIYTQAANYAGFVGRPPPPAYSAAKTGKQVWRRVDRAWLPNQLSLLNYPLAWGSLVAPSLVDRTLAVVFPLGATDLTRPVPPGSGNVLATREAGNRMRGGAGNSLVGIAKNLVVRLRRTPRGSGEPVQPGPTPPRSAGGA